MTELQLDLTLPRREFDVVAGLRVSGVLAITGTSGCGKTSLLRAVAGLENTAQGAITCAGQAWLAGGSSLPAERRSIGFAAQVGGLFPHLTALENVAYPLRCDGVDKRTSRVAASRLLARFGLRDVVDVAPPRLSGGQQRRVALARALVAERAVYLLDEPFAGLDRRSADHAADVIGEQLLLRGAPAIIAGHDLVRLSALAGRTVHMSRGRVIATAAEVSVSETAARQTATRAHAQAPVAAPRSTARRPSGFRGSSR